MTPSRPDAHEDRYQPTSSSSLERLLRFAMPAAAWLLVTLLAFVGPIAEAGGAALLALRALSLLGGIGAFLAAHELARRIESLEDEVDEEHARSEREIQEFSAGLGEWIWECDSEGRFTSCGPGVTSVLGFSPDVIKGARISDIAEPAETERAGARHDRSLREGEPLSALDVWCLTRQDERVCVRFEAAPLLDDSGAPRGQRGFARVITGQRKAEDELARTKAQLEAARAETKQLAGRAGAANRTQSDFVARMSHELRTPLNGMLGMTDELLESELEPAQKTSVEALRESSRRLSRLVGDILDLAKLEAGQALLQVAPFDVEKVVRTAVEDAREEAQRKGLALNVNVDDDLPGRVRGDAARVSQMVSHVIGNAVKFTESGRIDVRLRSLESEGDTLRLLFAVQDSGPGIPADMQRRILEPFGVVDNSVARRQEGSGLGLGLVARLAEAMGGKLGIESEPGEGSRIWLSLRFGAASRTEPGHTGPTGPFESVTVLVVDDNRINARVAGKGVERLGHEAITVLSGAEALDALRDTHVDLVLTDVQMPEMDGAQLARAIRAGEAGQSGVPIVALTAHGTRDDRDRCLSAGMNAYLTKPLDLEALRAVISRFVTTPVPA